MCAAPSAYGESAHDRGAKLFQEKGCSQCHSVKGVGGTKGPDLSAVGKRMKKPALEKQILQGGLNMPPFNEAITPAETHDLVEYLHKCKHQISAPVSASYTPKKSAAAAD